jgi:hypothetical protein
LAVLVVLPTSLGTSTSAAVVGGDVDELASVRATVGKVWVEVVAAACLAGWVGAVVGTTKHRPEQHQDEKDSAEEC